MMRFTPTAPEAEKGGTGPVVEDLNILQKQISVLVSKMLGVVK